MSRRLLAQLVARRYVRGRREGRLQSFVINWRRPNLVEPSRVTDQTVAGSIADFYLLSAFSLQTLEFTAAVYSTAVSDAAGECQLQLCVNNWRWPNWLQKRYVRGKGKVGFNPCD